LLAPLVPLLDPPPPPPPAMSNAKSRFFGTVTTPELHSNAVPAAAAGDTKLSITHEPMTEAPATPPKTLSACRRRMSLIPASDS
jgi:hypothetical protein